MKIGVTSFGMVGRPLVEALDWMVTFGAEATEINGRPGVHPGLLWEAGDVAKVKGMLRERGLVPTSLGGYNDFAQLDPYALEAQIEGFVVYCQRAVDLGIPVVRAFGADTKEGHTLAEFRDSIFKGFEEVLRRTESLGVKIGIENHGRLTNDGDFMQEIIQHVDSPRLGVTLDTGNFAWAGHDLETVERFFDQLLPRIFSLHIKDGIYEDGGFDFVPAGRGVMPVPRLLADLAGTGFQGGVISEYEGEDRTYEEGTLESVAYLRGLRDALAGG